MRLAASLVAIAFACAAITPTPIAADTTQGQTCPAGTKTEHLPAVDLWDVVRLIGADFRVNLQPSLSLPHVQIDTDLSCYTRAQALAFLEGMSLQLVPVGPKSHPVYMVYPSADAQRLVGIVRSYRLRYAAADADTKAQVVDALPADAYVAVRPANNTIIVSGSAYVLQRADQIIQALDIPVQTTIKTVDLNSGVSASDVVAALATKLPPNTLVANNSASTIIVSGTSDTVAMAETLIHSMDADILQVDLDVRVIDYFPTNDSSSVGVRLGGVDAQGNPQVGSGSTVALIPGFSLHGNVSLDLNSTKGSTDVSDEPSIRLANNTTGKINDATDYPFTFVDPLNGPQTKDDLVGLIVSVKPTISANGNKIALTLDVEDSDFSGYTPQNQPIIIKRSATVTLVTTDGHPVVLAHILENMDINSVQSVPLLSQIPLFGNLFKYRQTQKRKGTLMMEITPHVVKTL